MTYLQVESGEKILVNLVVDDMAIMKYLKFDGKKCIGAADIGAADREIRFSWRISHFYGRCYK